MGNHVAIPSNQIGNRCEDGAVIEVQQCRGWLPMSKETEGQQGYSMSLERHSRSHSLFMSRRAHLTPRKRRVGSGSSATLRRTRRQAIFPFIRIKYKIIRSFSWLSVLIQKCLISMRFASALHSGVCIFFNDFYLLWHHHENMTVMFQKWILCLKFIARLFRLEISSR